MVQLGLVPMGGQLFTEKILTDKSGHYYSAGIPPNLITEESKDMRQKAAVPSIIRELVQRQFLFARYTRLVRR